MGMANSVEGRFPFLDVRVVEFCNRLAPQLKMRGLTEKWLLKKAAQPWLPDIIRRRPKRPYRAPIHRSFFGQHPLPYVTELLSEEALKCAGIFKPAAVAQLLKKIQSGAGLGETDDMALAGILSTQLLEHHFVRAFRRALPISATDRVKVCNLAVAPSRWDAAASAA
jgi:asparagine synthase (glutamine-hydrolysing)